ncbi:MAG: hypothetical protein K2K56_09970 [Lachnospiraceae bacterium]|nr:hypothetical protein [Lachnospiraceae bacterium]
MINLSDVSEKELNSICDEYYPERKSYADLAEAKLRFGKECKQIESCIDNLLGILSEDVHFESELSADVSLEQCDTIRLQYRKIYDSICDVFSVMDKSRVGALYRLQHPDETSGMPFSYDKDLAAQVKVSQDDNITQVELPRLPPHKKQISRYSSDLSDGKSYEIDSYYKAIGDILGEMNYHRYYEKVVICFTFVYNEKERDLTDHDNLSLKSLIDLIAAFFLVDDSPDKCAHYYDYELGEKSRTIISVIPSSIFPEYISMRTK